MLEFLAFYESLALALLKSLALSESPCCKKKMVGEVNYTLVTTADTTNFKCDSDCLYEKDGLNGSKFCFKAGAQSANCVEDDAEDESEISTDDV